MASGIRLNEISVDDWDHALEYAEKNNGIIPFKEKSDGTIKVFNPEDNIKAAKYPHLSLQQVSAISQTIFLKAEKETDRVTLRDRMDKLIKLESLKATQAMEKAQVTWMNILKVVAYVSIIFSPLGLLISWNQQRAKKELETVQNLQIAQALSETTWTLPTNPAETFKSSLKDNEKKVPLQMKDNKENNAYLVPKQLSKDMVRWPMLCLNEEPIYSNFSSSLNSVTNAYDKLMAAFGETIDNHPLTDAALNVLVQTYTLNLIATGTKFVGENLHLQGWKNSWSDINIHQNSQGEKILTLQLKALSYENREDAMEQTPVTARAISRKLEMPLEEFRNAVEQKNPELLTRLKAKDRISDDLFRRTNVEPGSDDKEFLKTKPELIGTHQTVKSFSEVYFSQESASQILQNFNPKEESAGTWNLETAWTSLRNYGSY